MIHNVPDHKLADTTLDVIEDRSCINGSFSTVIPLRHIEGYMNDKTRDVIAAAQAECSNSMIMGHPPHSDGGVDLGESLIRDFPYELV